MVKYRYNQIMKTVLITGCSSGFGLLTAVGFAKKGYQVYAGVHNLKTIEKDKLRQLKQAQVQIIELDVTSDSSVKKSISEVIKYSGNIDILVNNAGFGFLGPAEAFTIEEAKSQFETNVWGAFRMIKEVIPIMRSNNSGTIITISSINGLVAFPLWGMYSSSKFALESMMEAFRFEVAPFGIKVALVEPGSFATKFSQNRKMPQSLNDPNSPYQKMMYNFFQKFDAVEKSGLNSKWMQKLLDPQKVADKIIAIAEQNKPKLHNKVGIDSHLYYWAKKWLPDGLWNVILNKVYS
jgi:NAD(P)-dependent dehydrogenase (short-subunit alcohol dehydrogenase family)